MGATSQWKAPPGWRTRIRPAVFATYGRRCWRCGAYATTVGHVVARALGGTWDLPNLRPECQPCNSSDGAALGNRLGGPRGYRRRGPRRPAVKAPMAPAVPAPLRTSRDW
jgi:5-methylcytosine-specific restriction endonuclease McrA